MLFLFVSIFFFFLFEFLYSLKYCVSQLNPFPNKPLFLRVCSTSLLKTRWEKEKLLVTSNFSLSHSVFYTFRKLFVIFIKSEIVIWKHFQFGSVQNLSFGKGLKRYPMNTDLMTALVYRR